MILFFSDQAVLDQYFPLLCNCLPDDYQSTLVKLKRLSQLSTDDHQQLGTMISSSCEVKLVNEKIITFLIVKLCYNGSSDSLVGLCDVMDNMVESDQSADCVQQLRCGKNYWFVVHFIYLTIPALTRDVSSPPANSSLQESSVTTAEKLQSVTCTQHDSSAANISTTGANMLSLSPSLNFPTLLSVGDEPIVGSVEQDIGIVTTGRRFYNLYTLLLYIIY